MKSEDPGNKYHIRLEPDQRGFDLRFDELWQYRDLVLLLTRRAFTVTYQQTVLGPLWIIINPLLASLVYMLVFGHIAEIGTAGIPRILFYFVSTAVWELFSFSTISNSNTFVTNAHLFSKVYFPRLAVPVSNMFVGILKFCVQLIIIAALVVMFTLSGAIHPMWGFYPLLPLLFIQISAAGMSAGILLSSLTTRYRDLQMVVNVGVSLLMYASPVVYPISVIPEGAVKALILLNPVSEPIELIRLIMLGEGEFSLAWYLLSAGITIALFLVSAAIFNQVERTFEDTV